MACGRREHTVHLMVSHRGGSPLLRLPTRPQPFLVTGALRWAVEPLGRLGAAVLLLSCVVSVIGVFVRLGGSRSIERQQLKWFAYVTAVLVSVMLLSPAAASVIGAMGGSWEVMIATIATPILTALLGIPVVIGIAILRYRLYDIDVIIN